MTGKTKAKATPNNSRKKPRLTRKQYEVQEFTGVERGADTNSVVVQVRWKGYEEVTQECPFSLRKDLGSAVFETYCLAAGIDPGDALTSTEAADEHSLAESVTSATTWDVSRFGSELAPEKKVVVYWCGWEDPTEEPASALI